MGDVIRIYSTQIDYLKRRIAELEVTNPDGDTILIYKKLLAKRQAEESLQ